MLIRSLPTPRRSLSLALLPPLLAMSGLAGSGLPWTARSPLMLVCLLRLGLVLRASRSSPRTGAFPGAACWIDVAEPRVLRWAGPDHFLSARLGVGTRIAAWGIGLATGAGSWISLPATQLPEAERRRLARWLLHGRPPPACWQPHVRACRSRQRRLRIRYNPVLPDAPAAPWPPF